MLDELKDILKKNNIPDNVITELSCKTPEYQEKFLHALKTIMQNEVLSLHAFMEAKEKMRNDRKKVIN